MESCERARQTPSADLKLTERAVTTFKAYSVQRFIQLMHTMAQRSCKVFCIPFQEKPVCCPDLLRHSPPTYLIVNINNSTLTDCVIGDTYPCAARDLDPLMLESQLQRPDQPRCSCRRDQQDTAQTAPPAPPLPQAQHLNISIHSSRLDYVIIGDNNCMHMELSEVD